MIKIAILEDSDADYTRICKAWDRFSKEENLSYQITHYKDSTSLLEQFHSQFDLIFLDIEMPEMSGLEFLSQMKTNELYADVPIVVMSSLGEESQKRKALSLGADNYVVKGEFNQTAFVDMVSNILLKYSD